jgi:hypothetical protein
MEWTEMLEKMVFCRACVAGPPLTQNVLLNVFYINSSESQAMTPSKFTNP